MEVIGMKLGVLGTGMVGNTIGSKLVQVSHELKMGSRTSGNEKAVQWAKANEPKAAGIRLIDHLFHGKRR